MKPSIEIIKPNLTRIDLPHMTVWFSYGTMIAFCFNGGPRRVVSNYCWGATTEKHIKSLEPGKKNRLESTTFEAEWKKGPPDTVDNLAWAAICGDRIARDAIMDTIQKGG